MTMKVALIGHRGGNIGHDLMTIGMSEALREAFGSDVEIAFHEQHHPFDVHAPGHWVRIANHLPHGQFGLIRRTLARDDVRERLWRKLPRMPYALAVACGGPNFVPGAGKTPEMRLLLHNMNGAFAHRGIPLIDAGVGSAFPLERPPHLITDEVDRAFYKKALSYVAQIMVRERYAQAACADLGVETEIIPCGAIGSGRVIERMTNANEDRYVLVNFQARGSNTDWGQKVDLGEWWTTVRRVIDDLSRRHDVRMLAHDVFEAKLARQLAPELACYQPTDVKSYARAAAGAKAAFVSRIHAAVPLAEIGVPSLVVGNDTRIATVETLGLPTMPVKAASAEAIVAQVEALIVKGKIEYERLRHLREDTMRRYAEIFRKHARTQEHAH